MKRWLVHNKKQRVVLASRRRWNSHWVELRAARLLLYAAAAQPRPGQHISMCNESDLQFSPDHVIGTAAVEKISLYLRPNDVATLSKLLLLLLLLHPFNDLFSGTTCVSQYQKSTRSSATAEGPRDASCQLKSCQLPRNSAETTYTTSPDQIDGMKLEI